MMWFVIDPEDGKCYGKYGMSESSIPSHWGDIVSVEKEELTDYEVVDWRYE